MENPQLEIREGGSLSLTLTPEKTFDISSAISEDPHFRRSSSESFGAYEDLTVDRVEVCSSALAELVRTAEVKRRRETLGQSEEVVQQAAGPRISDRDLRRLCDAALPATRTKKYWEDVARSVTQFTVPSYGPEADPSLIRQDHPLFIAV